MGSSEGQTYCLRWNNHKSNLVEILDVLVKMENYVDCTLYVDGNVQFKAHRVVLAANSPYFQSILQAVPNDHCSILCPGVSSVEMRTLLEYMYSGEVNVAQSEIPRIMKIAEQLEIKGLFDMADMKYKMEKFKFEEPQQFFGTFHQNKRPTSTDPYTPGSAGGNGGASSSKTNHHQFPHHQSSPVISTSTNVSSAQSSSSSPPYNYKSPYSSLYPRSPGPSTGPDRGPQWPPLTTSLPTQHLQSAAAAMLSSVYESGSDMNPLKRKKISSISSMLMSRDTPILRNVLAQPNAADSSQPVPLVCQPGDHDRQSTQSNGSTDYSSKNVKNEEPHSPYTDKSFEDDTMESPQNFSGDSRIAPYVPQQQKPEWKRYKQYTRNDILSAIECVRNGMSALQASRKFGVPSRTLYDKVKKLGITTGRPMNRTIKRSPSNGPSSAFPYGISGTTTPYSHHSGGQDGTSMSHQGLGDERDREQAHHLPPTIPHPAAALLDATFLQQALEARGGDIAGREALHAMAFAAAAHAAVNGISTSPGTHGTARSPSPSHFIKYMRRSRTPPDNDRDNHHGPDEDYRAEDLSMVKKEMASPSGASTPLPQGPSHHSPMSRDVSPAPPVSPPHSPPGPPVPSQGVIVPPLTKVSPTLKDPFLEERQREASPMNDEPHD
ncbi:broad-complex core protein [Phlebotomus papatasi]|uniref:broad-complex core protein n=1 Tax=Phlebotomus papatasi TaxID=29031 RepID=UPI002484081C|nr:broad-complex core protein [Phlebotomus papatasi]